MIPILYPTAETEFKTNGLGALYDAISCEVQQELNGEYELVMQHPVKGLHFKEIELRTIIKAKPDTVTDPQPFRVYRITKPINGVVTVYARHLAYDLAGIPVSPFTADGVGGALTALKSNAAVECPFTFKTSKSGGGTMTVATPASVWSRLGGTEGSILDLYGGEYSFDTYTVMLNTRRGADNGVAIRYGKNLTDLEQDANCANCYTGVYPYWHLENKLVTLPEKMLHAEGAFGYTRILPLDLTDRFEEAPTEEALRSAAVSYMETNNIGVPAVSWKVGFVALEQTEEYRGTGILERISLGDTVLVEFDELGVNASARAVKTVYNVLAERYENITLGRVRSTLAQTIVDQQKDIERKPSLPLVEKISALLLAAILGANGGAVRQIDTNGDGFPDELYIADNPDPAQAIKVWRFNYEGWAASKTGYNGPFVLGATLDDGLLASFVTAANLVAGTIQSQDGKTFFLDLDNGVLKGEFSSLTISGKTVDAVATEKASAAQSAAIAAAAADAAQKANTAEQNAKAHANAINSALNQLEIFNRLTNNGTAQGIYLSNGQLYINATYLKSGTISSDLINTLTLFAKDITMTGTFTNTTNAFLEPNQTVVDRINQHLLGTSPIPSSQTSLYDFNGNGQIDIADLVQARNAALGKSSLASWSGATKTPVTCTIDLSNPAKALVMSGTDMWGNYRESVIGVDPATATFVARSLLDSIVTMDASGIMSRSIDGETEYFNPNLFSSQEDAPQEYRTTERWDNSPVYVRCVKYKYSGQLGSTTKATSLDIPHGIPWDSSYQLVRIEATLNRAKVLPHLVSGGGMTIVNGVDNDNINLLVRNDYWNSPEFYFRIYYIKNWVGE